MAGGVLIIIGLDCRKKGNDGHSPLRALKQEWLCERVRLVAVVEGVLVLGWEIYFSAMNANPNPIPNPTTGL